MSNASNIAGDSNAPSIDTDCLGSVSSKSLHAEIKRVQANKIYNILFFIIY